MGDQPRVLSYGEWTEKAVREMAAWGGQPDFVYRPTIIRKGAASREVGDAMIWVGRRILVVSVKSRDISLMGEDGPSRSRRWLNKAVAKACRQIDGTVRELRTPTEPIVLVNERGVEIPWDPNLADEIYGVIAVNYTPPPNYVARISTTEVRSIALLAPDWLFLNCKLWSTSSTVNYVALRVEMPPIPLGLERDVFGHVMESEEKRQPLVLPGGLPVSGKWDEVRGRYPDRDFGAVDDHKYARVLDAVIDGAADQNPLYSSYRDPKDYLRIVEILDRIPMLERIGMGQDLLRRAREAGRTKTPQAGIWFPSEGRDRTMITFLADPADREGRVQLHQSRTYARHTQLVEAVGNGPVTTLGIATEPYPNDGRSQDFVLLEGDIPLPPEKRGERDDLFGALPVPDEILDKLRASLPLGSSGKP